MNHREILSLQEMPASCRYDLARHIVRITIGEHYADPDEASFFGEAISLGEFAGFEFLKVNNYSSSNVDHIQIGTIEEIQVNDSAPREVEISLECEDAPNLGGKVRFTFQAIRRIQA